MVSAVSDGIGVLESSARVGLFGLRPWGAAGRSDWGAVAVGPGGQGAGGGLWSCGGRTGSGGGCQCHQVSILQYIG